MSKIKIINPSVDTISMMLKSYLMLGTGEQGTVKSTPSKMYDPYAHVIEQRSYWLSIYIVLNLNDILGRIVFVPGGNDEYSNGALNVVYSAIFSSF